MGSSDDTRVFTRREVRLIRDACRLVEVEAVPGSVWKDRDADTARRIMSKIESVPKGAVLVALTPAEAGALVRAAGQMLEAGSSEVREWFRGGAYDAAYRAFDALVNAWQGGHRTVTPPDGEER
jgi:hypothetical protein